MRKHRIGVIGLGKIARDQHLPVLAAGDAFEVAAVASRSGATAKGVPLAFRDHQELLARTPGLDAVAVCTPPDVRHGIARDALAAGVSVLLEKPPAATLGEVADLERAAGSAGRTLFATWHSRFNTAVEAARKALEGKRVARLLVSWKEDVRKWHPGQDWVWRAGGFGVFDPGINAFSILTRILPEPIFVRRAELLFPEGKDAPIAAEVEFRGAVAGAALHAEFDWRHTGDEAWDIEVEVEGGPTFRLSAGGTRLEVDGRLAVDEPAAEYAGIYERFDALLRSGASEVDARPLELVADAFLLGRRVTVEPFEA